MFCLKLTTLTRTMIIRIWIMMYCFRRHHYNKLLLTWLSLLNVWKENRETEDLYNFFSSHLSAVDVYTVEHVHSVIRRHTVDTATEEQLRQTIMSIFGSNTRQCNFRSVSKVTLPGITKIFAHKSC